MPVNVVFLRPQSWSRLKTLVWDVSFLLTVEVFLLTVRLFY